MYIMQQFVGHLSDIHVFLYFHLISFIKIIIISPIYSLYLVVLFTFHYECNPVFKMFINKQVILSMFVGVTQ